MGHYLVYLADDLDIGNSHFENQTLLTALCLFHFIVPSIYLGLALYTPFVNATWQEASEPAFQIGFGYFSRGLSECVNVRTVTND